MNGFEIANLLRDPNALVEALIAGAFPELAEHGEALVKWKADLAKASADEDAAGTAFEKAVRKRKRAEDAHYDDRSDAAWVTVREARDDYARAETIWDRAKERHRDVQKGYAAAAQDARSALVAHLRPWAGRESWGPFLESQRTDLEALAASLARIELAVRAFVAEREPVAREVGADRPDAWALRGALSRILETLVGGIPEEARMIFISADANRFAKRS